MKPTLIIVDDVPGIRKTLRAALREDFEILQEAADGKEAIEAVARLAPQFVVMDIVMPNMSGIEATRWIMNQPGVNPKIIIVSGLKDDSVVFQALEAGACDYLFKPVDPEKLRDVLKSFLKVA